MKPTKRRHPALFRKSRIEPIQDYPHSSGMISILHSLKGWLGPGILLLLIATTYLLGEIAPVLRTFNFWAVLSAILICTAVALHFKIKSVFASPRNEIPPYWTILSRGYLYSGFLGFLCFLTAGYVLIFFTH